jgi:hypothetical protein
VSDIKVLITGCQSTTFQLQLWGRISYVDAFVGETRRDGGAFLFGFIEEDRKLFNCGHRNVSSVVPGKKGLRLFISTAFS